MTLDARASLARDAYVFTYPLVMNYRTMYMQAIKGDRRFGQWLHLGLSSPADTDIVTSNNDTPYPVRLGGSARRAVGADHAQDRADGFTRVSGMTTVATSWTIPGPCSMATMDTAICSPRPPGRAHPPLVSSASSEAKATCSARSRAPRWSAVKRICRA